MRCSRCIGGRLISEGDRLVCLHCGDCPRDDANVTDAACHDLSGLGGLRVAGTNSSRRYTTEALTAGLVATKGYHDV